MREAAEQLRSQRPEDRTAPGTVARMPQRRQLLLGGIAASFGALAGYGGRELLDTDPTAPTAAPNPPTEAIAFAGAPRACRPADV